MTMPRMPIAPCLGALLALVPAFAAPHDLWIIPASFRPQPGAPVDVEVRIGEVFPVSMNGPKADSLVRLALVTAAGTTAIAGAAEKGKVLAARAVAPAAGTAAIVLEGKPRFIELSAGEFKDYVLHEGLAHIHEQRVKRGEGGKPGRESYSRHAKTLVRSTPGKGVATERLGLDLELVPAKDPYDLVAGQPLPVTALFRGQPLAGLELRAYQEGSPVLRAVTGPDGNATLTLGDPGIWCIAFIHMTRCSDCDKADWRSYFGSLTFELAAAP